MGVYGGSPAANMQVNPGIGGTPMTGVTTPPANGGASAMPPSQGRFNPAAGGFQDPGTTGGADPAMMGREGYQANAGGFTPNWWSPDMVSALNTARARVQAPPAPGPVAQAPGMPGPGRAPVAGLPAPPAPGAGPMNWASMLSQAPPELIANLKARLGGAGGSLFDQIGSGSYAGGAPGGGGSYAGSITPVAPRPMATY